MQAVTVKREGSAYLDEQLSANGLPSATALRRKWREDGVETILPFLPPACSKVMAHAGGPADLAYAERLILGHFRLTPADVLESAAELSGGLGSRMSQAAQKASDLEEFFTLSATKKYPNARLRRGILFTLTGITQKDLRTPPAYVRLLAANGVGCDLLSRCRRHADIPVVTRRTDLPDTDAARAQAEIEARAWGLYTLCLPRATSVEGLWRTSPIIKI